MAGRKKDSNNFEKIKREMSKKKQRANKQENTVDILTDTDKCNAPKDLIREEMKTEMVVFFIGTEEFALDISNVVEIIRLPSICQVPNTPLFVKGLCNLRGELLPVVDSRRLFGLTEVEYDEGARIVVALFNGNRVGLIADKVSGVISIEKSMIKEPPQSIIEVDGGVINGILLLEHGKRVVMVFDATKIVRVGNLDEYSSKIKKKDVTIENPNKIVQREEQYVIFSIGSSEYAITISNVKEIIRLPVILKVPNAASYIEGVFSMRNQLLPAINLGELLNENSNAIDEQRRVAIVDNGNMTFGVYVDRVSQVLRTEMFPLGVGNKGTKELENQFLKGFLNLDNGKRLVMILDTLNLISTEDASSVLSSDIKKADSMVHTNNENESNLEHIVIFKLGDQELGIKIDYVKEINRVSDIIRFPGSPTFIEGMTNLRGEIIPVLNLKTMFNHESSAYESNKFLVVDYKNKRIGIIIDSVSEVIKLPKSCLEKVSEALEGNDEERYIDAVAKLNGGERIVLLLNLLAVLNFM